MHRHGSTNEDWLVFDPEGDFSVGVSETLNRMRDTGISHLTVPGYARGALSFLDFHWRRLSNSTAQATFTPWSSPTDVQKLFADMLRSLRATITPSTTEKGVLHVEVPPEMTDKVTQLICGTYHFYSAAELAGVYQMPNPFEIPEEDRVRRRVPGGQPGQPWPETTGRFRFRIPASTGSALRTDSSESLPLIVPALISFGVPTAIVMMIKVMIEGLARILEQCRLTVWDWWKASQFGETILTTNKGCGKRRTKVQTMSLALVGELLLYFDMERRELDPDGWGLDDWRDFLTDATISPRVRMAKALRAPLFPNRSKRFHTRSGVIDVWYRPAMNRAGLPTRTHYIRHCGVNDFLAWVEARTDLTVAQVHAGKLAFAKDMGWRWPLVMLERYSLPQRREAAISLRRAWTTDRIHKLALIHEGLGRPAPAVLPPTRADKPMSRLFRYATDMKLAA